MAAVIADALALQVDLTDADVDALWAELASESDIVRPTILCNNSPF